MVDVLYENDFQKILKIFFEEDDDPVFQVIKRRELCNIYIYIYVY